MTARIDVENFLKQKSLAVVGVSRKGNKFGNTIYKELKQKGYQAYAVNRHMVSIMGDPCYASLKAIPGGVDGVVLVVQPEQSEDVVREAKDAGIRYVWMQQGAQSYTAIRYCQENNITVIANECLLMFLEPVGTFHKFHRWLWKIFGKLPQ